MGKSIRYALAGFVLGSLWISANGSQAHGRERAGAIAPASWELSEVDGPERRGICVADAETPLKLHAGRAGCARTMPDRTANLFVTQYRRAAAVDRWRWTRRA